MAIFFTMSLLYFVFKVARRLYFRKRYLPCIPSSDIYWNADDAPRLLNEWVASTQPFMIARFGSVELACMANYIAHRDGFKPLDYIKGSSDFPNWNTSSIQSLCINAGFFPQDLSYASRFCELMLDCAREVDVLGSWLKYEELIYPNKGVARVALPNLEPFDDSGNPWSRHLRGKRVLVVHPFAETIQSQYQNKRELLFSNKEVLPEFHLQTIKAVQSMGGVAPEGMETWFDALEHMKQQIDACDYDVCLLGCGAYGFPLAAHVKRQGKQAIHMGGALQLLFGIKGKRWLVQYGTDESNPYLKLFNEHWVFPDSVDKPAAADCVEDGCYW